jgi:fluoride exporter
MPWFVIHKEIKILQKYLLIATGGALGSIARYWVSISVTNRMGTRFPYGTLLINISACFVIGLCLSILNIRPEIHPSWRFLIPIGFIGAYSTFSTFEWETLTTAQSGAIFLSLVYVLASVLAGLIAVWCGAAIAKVLS